MKGSKYIAPKNRDAEELPAGYGVGHDCRIAIVYRGC